MKKGDRRLQRALLYLALVLALEVVATTQNLDEPPSWAFTVAGPTEDIVALAAYAASLKP